MGDRALCGLPTPLLERDTEIGQIGRGLTALDHGTGGVLAIEAAPGLGKSSLLKVVHDRAVAAGFRVLSARGNELERNYAFGTVAQLLEADPGDPGPGDDPPLAYANAEADWPATLRHLQRRLLDRAGDSRLVVVVDDARWVDPPSLRLLSYLGARAERTPLLLAFALDTADRGSAIDWLHGAAMSPEATVLRPAPLSEQATRKLVSATLGEAAAAAIAEACFDATAGNLLLLREILDEAATGRWEAVESLPSWLSRHAPAGVARRLLRRLRRLPEQAHAVARAVAVLGAAADPVAVARTVDCPDHEFDDAVAALIDAEFMADGPVLQFAQPILRTALYTRIPTVSRGRLHARAARVLIEIGAPAHEVTKQLAGARPAGERWVAEKLAELGGTATGGRRLWAVLPSPCGAADATLEATPPVAADPGGVVDGVLARAWALALDCRFEQAITVLGKDMAESYEPDAIARMETMAACVAQLSPGTRVRHRADSRAREPDRSTFLPEAGTRELLDRLWQVTSADQLAELAERLLRAPADGLVGAVVGLVAAGTLARYDRLPEARQAVEGLGAAARQRGVALAGLDLALLAAIDYQLGHIDGAGELARQALAGGDAAGPPRLVRALATAVAVHVLIEQGAHEAAEAALAEADSAAGAGIGDVGGGPAEVDSVADLALLYARGRLRVERGDVERGLGDLFRGRRIAGHLGLPLRALVSWSPAVIALHGLGRVDEALAMGREELALARSSGTPRLVAVALRTLGSVTPGSTGLALLAEAAALIEGFPGPVERARTQLAYGVALRGAGKDIASRHQVRLAAGAAGSCGALVLHRRALAELRLIDAADSGWPQPLLTPRQYEVAQLAAEGLANQEIARTLFVTVKTVEWHLTQAYRKLGVDSRAALSAALAAATPAGRRP